MQLIKKTVAVLGLFLFSFGLPKMFLKYIINISEAYHQDIKIPSSGTPEDIVTNFGTFLLWLFSISLCIWMLDTTTKDKKLFSATIPRQTNQLTPIISGIIIGCSNVARYYS